MQFLSVPDYYSQFAHLTGFEFILNVIVFIITFYLTMCVFIILNALLLASVCWSMLILCRLFGIPWVDGTTRGYIRRE